MDLLDMAIVKLSTLNLKRLLLASLCGAALSACSVAHNYTEKEQSIVDSLDGGLYQPASRTARDNIETQTPFAQAAFWAREYQLNPGDLESAVKLSAALRKIGNPAKAVETAQLARAMHPRDPYLTAEFAAALIATERGADAIKPLQDGLRLTPQYARLWSLMGAALDQNEQYEQARKHYGRALSITPNDPSILANMGLSFALQGDAATAETWLRRAAAMPGASQGVRQNLDLVLQLQGKTPPASQTAERAPTSNYPPTSIKPARTEQQQLAPYGAPREYRNSLSIADRPAVSQRQLARPQQQAAPQITPQNTRMRGTYPQAPSAAGFNTPQATAHYNYSNSPSVASLQGAPNSANTATQSAPKTAMDAARAAAARSQGRKVTVPAGAPTPQSTVLETIANNVGPRSATGVPAAAALTASQAPQNNAYAPTRLPGYGPQNFSHNTGQPAQQYGPQNWAPQTQAQQAPKPRGPARRR